MRICITYLLNGESHKTVLPLATRAKTARGKDEAVRSLFAESFAGTGATLVGWEPNRRKRSTDSPLMSELQAAMRERGLGFTAESVAEMSGLTAPATRPLFYGAQPTPDRLRQILNGLGIEGEARGRWWRLAYDEPL